MTGIPASWRIRSANGTWYMRPYSTRASGAFPPEETSIRSHPRSRSARASATASSGVMPPSAQSVPLSRTEIGRCAGHTSRTAAKTSSGQRMRFPSEPPKSSRRRLARGERKLESR